MKKFLIILIILLVLIIGFFLLYNYFLKEETPTPQTSEEIDFEQTTELTAQGIQVISQEPVLNPVIDGNKIKYYSASNGNVFQSDFDGSNLTRLSSNILTDIVKVLWSPDREKVIGVFESNQYIKKYLYDFQEQKSVLLNENIRELAWAPARNASYSDAGGPDYEKIAYQYYDSQSGENNINIAEPDGSQWETILNTRMKNLIVEWPVPDKISIRTKPSGLAQSAAYLIDLSTGNQLKKIFSDIYGLSALWSPRGDKVIYSETDNQGKNLKLKIADKEGQLIGETKLPTLPEKCVWSQDNRNFFCAAPKVIASKAVMPDDYYKGTLDISDDFYKINLETGQAFLLSADLESYNYDANNLMLSPNEDYLFFVNRKDGLLYSLEL